MVKSYWESIAEHRYNIKISKLVPKVSIDWENETVNVSWDPPSWIGYWYEFLLDELGVRIHNAPFYTYWTVKNATGENYTVALNYLKVL